MQCWHHPGFIRCLGRSGTKEMTITTQDNTWALMKYASFVHTSVGCEHLRLSPPSVLWGLTGITQHAGFCPALLKRNGYRYTNIVFFGRIWFCFCGVCVCVFLNESPWRSMVSTIRVGVRISVGNGKFVPIVSIPGCGDCVLNHIASPLWGTSTWIILTQDHWCIT